MKTQRGKMKEFLLAVLILGMVALSACSGESPTPSGGAATPVGQNATPAPLANATQAVATTANLNTDYENAASVELQLLLGTLQLTGDLAVTPEQASTLLPLWQEFQTLSQSMMPAPGAPGQSAGDATPPAANDSAATQAQLDTLIAQISAAMTPAQLQAIAALQLTQDSALTLMQTLGLTPGGPQGPGNNAGGGNQPPQGTPPAGGPGGQQPGSGDTGTPPGGQRAGGGMIMPELITALLQQLEAISTGQATSALPQPALAALNTGDTLAVYTLKGETATETGKTYVATETDQSAVYVTDGGVLVMTGATIKTSGNTSSNDNSSFYGLNAAVLAANAGQITLSDSTIETSGSGANGAFATGNGSSVTLSNVTITATGGGGHGVMATNGGVMTLTDVDMTTAGKNSGAIATDRGGGTINVTGGIVTTTGQDSPGIYSTGDIRVSEATITASGAEAAVIEGANSIDLTNTTLTSSMADKWGVMIYQSMSGDAEGTRGVFTMTGGTLAYTSASGPLFFVTNSTGVITLKGVNVTATSGTLVNAAGTDRWGQSGANGGTVLFTADQQALAGDLVADSISSIALTLQNGSALTGAINSAHTAQALSLTLDATSTWTVTADSYLTSLTDPAGISGTTITNIIGNGHTVYYDPAACPALGGATYTLKGGGTLQPIQ